MISILRAYEVPALRYVSGYIHRPGKESQSHAWCEAWLPEMGWVGLDPTNDCVTDENFIKVAIRPRLLRRASEQGPLSQPGF